MSVERIRTLGVIPVVELDAVEQAQPLLDALTAGGLPAAEITLRTPTGFDALVALLRSHPDAFVGAGTVRTVADARRVVDAGAQFVVSPATNLEVIELCRAAGVLVMPGACTPTEVDAADRAGAPLVKFFPAEPMGGIRFLKALAGPFPDVDFVPTGGIDASNLADYLRLPHVVACGGTWLVARALLREGRFDRVEALAREAVEIASEVRRASPRRVLYAPGKRKREGRTWAEQDERPESTEEDVEGHLIKEALAAGAATAAFVAASPAGAQNVPGDGGAGVAKAAAPNVHQDPSGGASGSRFVLPEPGAGGGQVAPAPSGSSQGKIAKKAAKKKHGRK